METLFHISNNFKQSFLWTCNSLDSQSCLYMVSPPGHVYIEPGRFVNTKRADGWHMGRGLCQFGDTSIAAISTSLQPRTFHNVWVAFLLFIPTFRPIWIWRLNKTAPLSYGLASRQQTEQTAGRNLWFFVGIFWRWRQDRRACLYIFWCQARNLA